MEPKENQFPLSHVKVLRTQNDHSYQLKNSKEDEVNVRSTLSGRGINTSDNGRESSEHTSGWVEVKEAPSPRSKPEYLYKATMGTQRPGERGWGHRSGTTANEAIRKAANAAEEDRLEKTTNVKKTFSPRRTKPTEVIKIDSGKK
jgi:hypothetical protein